MRREALLVLALVPAGLLAEESAAATGPPRIREIYVPSSELQARIAREPRGVVMTLDEYRALVLRALPRQGAEPPEIPPLEASVVAARYEGKLSERAVRLRATLEVRSTRDGWALLDLGRPLEGLGAVLVDGRPGFIIIDSAPRPAKDGEARLVEEPRARLLLEGAGAHTVTLEASLPVSVNDDRWSLEGRLVPAAASRIEVEVPGSVAATSEPPFLDISKGNGASRLVLAAGRAQTFRLEWRRAEERGESGALVAAEHRVVFLLHPRSPTFGWEADVLVARGKVAFLDLREPPSARVLAVEGQGVVSWARVEDGIRVFLAEPSEGRIPLRLSGVLEPAARFELGPPGAAGSFASWGSMAIRADPSARVRIESAAAVDEVGTGDPLVERVYAFSSDGARVVAALEGVPARFESRAAYLLSVGEAASVLEGALRIAPAEGRIHRFPLALPDGWRLAALVEAPREGVAPRGIRHEEAASRLVEVHLGRAASRGDPADVRFRLEREGTGGEPGAGEIDLALPAAPGAARSRTDVAVSLPPSLDARMPELPGWRSLPLEELELLGLAPAAERPLAAGLSTDSPAPRLRFTLVERPARGEYRLAVFLLALERQVRVRADMRIAAVDRPIREVAVVLPPGAIGGAVVAGDGIQDSRADAVLSARIARWSKPWLGARQIRVEYEVPHEEGAAVPLPSVDVRIPGGGRLGGERFLLIQSRGPVEVETSPGPGLAPAAVEDIPDLAEPWSEGRILTAFRYRPAGDPGTFRTTVHDRAPVLASIAREVKLTTVIGRDGTSRTRAEVLVARSTAQRLVIVLPGGATPVAATVDGDPLRAVGPPGPADGAAAEAGPRSISIPLPARSHSAVVLVYERLAGGARTLGSAGTWTEDGPSFAGMPVGSTRWDIHHPAGYRFEPSGGNMVAPGERSGREGFFAETFIAPLFSGNRPRFTALEATAPAGAPAPLPPLTPEEALGADEQGRVRRVEGGLIEPAGDQQRGKQAGMQGDAAVPVYRLVPEGATVEVSKLGGDARIVLAYERSESGRSARLAVFSAVLVLGALLGIRLGARKLTGIALAGLSIGTLLPLALSMASPLLVVPACEALLVLAAAAGMIWAARHLASRRRAARALAAALLVLVPAGALRSDETAVPCPEGALIPYDPVKGISDPRGLGNEVYVPEKVFSELWRRAYPDALPPEPPPAEIVAGSGEYRLRVDEGGGSWRMTGSLPVRVLTDEWVSLPLPFTRSRLVSLRVDGEPASAAEVPSSAGGPSRTLLPLRGRGSRRVEIEVAGTLDREHGARIALIEVAAGAGSSIRAELPRGARVEARAPPGIALPVTVESTERGLVAVLDLGVARIAELRWSFPGVEGDTGTQLESLSYTELALRFEGIAVERRERLRATGRPVDSARYAAPAGWRITDVSGPEVARWSVGSAENGGERLEVFFARPVASAEIRVKGLAPLEASGPLPVLVLEGAARAETYVGIRHGGGRRFEADILAGMRRASRDDVARVFGLAAEEAPDRAYHAFGSGAGETLTIDPRGGDVACDTRLVMVIEESRLVLAARSRLAITGEGPLRFELLLPDGWEVRGVRCDGMRGWDAAPAPGGRRLSVRFEGRARSGTEVLWSAERAWSAPAPLDLPALAAAFPGAGTSREDRLWTVAASDALDVASLESPGLVPAPLEPLEAWALLPSGADARFALRSARGEAAPAEGPRLAVSRRESALRAVIVCVARLAEDALHVNARLVLRPTRGQRRAVPLPPPAGSGARRHRDGEPEEPRRPAPVPAASRSRSRSTRPRRASIPWTCPTSCGGRASCRPSSPSRFSPGTGPSRTWTSTPRCSRDRPR